MCMMCDQEAMYAAYLEWKALQEQAERDGAPPPAEAPETDAADDALPPTAPSPFKCD